SVPENNIAEVKQKPFTPPTVSPTELTTYIGTPPSLSTATALTEANTNDAIITTKMIELRKMSPELNLRSSGK
ncbi:hypothetical protein ACQX4W_11235, partial [Corynebacterium diphtheriae]